MASNSRATAWDNTISREAFIRCIALFTLLEGVLVAGGTIVSYSWNFSWMLLIGTFIVAVGGIILFQLSDNPLFSGIGVSVMSVALGMMIGPYVALYNYAQVFGAVVLTGAVMVIMSIVGILFPRIFVGWGSWLMAGLSVLLVALFAQAFFVLLGINAANTTFINNVLTWGGILLFTCFIPYDWGKAINDRNYTVDVAIDASGGLILDAVNLFIRILALSGGSRSSD